MALQAISASESYDSSSTFCIGPLSIASAVALPEVISGKVSATIYVPK